MLWCVRVFACLCVGVLMCLCVGVLVCLRVVVRAVVFVRACLIEYV